MENEFVWGDEGAVPDTAAVDEGAISDTAAVDARDRLSAINLVLISN